MIFQSWNIDLWSNYRGGFGELSKNEILGVSQTLLIKGFRKLASRMWTNKILSTPIIHSQLLDNIMDDG